jgi:hypothetical protein
MNGKENDNPLTDLLFYGYHPLPDDIEAILLRIDAVGRARSRWPLGENWPFSPLEFYWARGEKLWRARRKLRKMLQLLEARRGDEVLVDPRTGKPFSASRRE